MQIVLLVYPISRKAFLYKAKKQSYEKKYNNFGYNFIIQIFDKSNDENIEFNDNDDEYVIDENEIINFLDDYYSLFPEKIPNIEL